MILVPFTATFISAPSTANKFKKTSYEYLNSVQLVIDGLAYTISFSDR